MRLTLALSVALLTALSPQSAAAEPSDASDIESLGRELLDDLTPEVLKPPTAAPGAGAPMPGSNRVGSDIGSPSGPLPLVRVRQGMQHAHSLLAQATAAVEPATLRQAGVTQQQIVAQLDELIEELSKQCRGGQCQQGGQGQQPDQQSESEATDASSAAGQSAARDSDSRLDGAAAKPAEEGDLETLINRLWGHLPERARQQMLQSFSDEFLPKYELEIEQYYRRLSEESADGHR